MAHSYLTLSLLAVFAAGPMTGLATSAFAQDRATAEANSADNEAQANLVAKANAPLFEGMGKYHRPVRNISPEAQRYFDQGMVLAFGFNHAESIRSFRAAQRLDPQCAMCFWGEALATGPNINVTSKGRAIMSDEERRDAFAAINRADALKANASPVEKALIEAMKERYNGDPATDREPLDRAYATALGKVVAAFPNDDDAAAMYAEALMNTMPWDYWSAQGEPKPDTRKIVQSLETILARSPQHPLALHLYIHAVEASPDPSRAEDEADRLAGLVPGSGHLVHMPAHIYWRVGRYQDAVQANIRAASVDEQYIAACNAQGFYPALYYPHNIHFLWAASSMSGQSGLALSSAQKLADNVRLEQIKQFPSVEFFKTIPLLAKVQFGRWKDILAEPQPPQSLDYSNAIWRYARGVALANQGNVAGAKAERMALASKKDTVQISFLDNADYPASTLLGIADDLLLGEIALAQGKADEAAARFAAAVERQDTLPYMEPPFWYYPTRQSLGAALIAQGKFAEAEKVYRRDLEDYPRNGWSLSGLVKALKRQGREQDAADVKKRFDTAWQFADVTIDGSRL